MKIGVILPHDELPDRPATWETVRKFATSAEQGGLDSVWVFDHLFHQSADGRAGLLEAWTTLAAVAAVTKRVEIGALVMCSPFRHPVLMAKMAAAADEVSGGRLILGLGAGWHAPEFAALGLSMDQRVGRFDESLQIITALLRGERLDFAGVHHQVQGAELLPAPTRQIPILVAALRPRMLRLTARYADAWNIAWYGAPNDHLATTMAALRSAMDAEGRDPTTMTITVGVTVHDPDSGTAPDPGDEVLTGSPDDLARAFDAYSALGVDHLVVIPQPHTERTLDLLCAARTKLG